MMRGMNRIVWTGVTITALSLSTVAGWKAWFNSRSWTLIDDVPISLAKGIRYSSHVLPVNVSQQYAIQVHVSNNLAPEILRCQLGTGSRQNPCDPPSPFRVHWVLSSEGRIVQEGWDTPDDLGELSAGTTESSRFIALFKLKNGHRYKIDLDVLSDSANLNVTDPHLYFGEFDTVLEFDLVVSGLL